MPDFVRPGNFGISFYLPIDSLIPQGVRPVCNAGRAPQGCHSQRPTAKAASIPAICAATKAGTPAGAIPEKVSESARAMVTAGLAKEVEAVNQEAATI